MPRALLGASRGGKARRVRCDTKGPGRVNPDWLSVTAKDTYSINEFLKENFVIPPVLRRVVPSSHQTSQLVNRSKGFRGMLILFKNVDKD